MDNHFFPCFQSLKQSFSFIDIEPNVQHLNHYSGLNQTHPETSVLISNKDNLFLGNLMGTVPELFMHEGNNVEPSFKDPLFSEDDDSREKKRKPSDLNPTEISTANSSQHSYSGSGKKSVSGRSLNSQVSGRRKKVKGNGKEEEEQREVVHVRAKRGQATDSHSLAERIRREKINERFRCLQDIVPGCYKTMGMAVMLDETINYVQSLQNQVEFLSMKLNTTSNLHGFNSETDVIESMQEAKVFEKVKIQKVAGQEFASGLYPQVDLNSGYYLHLPHNQ